MAGIKAIAAVGKTLAGLIREAYYQSGFHENEDHESGSSGDPLGVQFRLIQGRDLDRPSPLQNKRGVSIYLHRVALSAQGRNLPALTTPGGGRPPPAVTLDLHYLVTAWWQSESEDASAEDAREQQWLLALALRALEDNPVLPAGFLNHFGQDSIFGENETVHIVGEMLSMSDLVCIWEVNKARMQPSVSYVARAVRIDSRREPPERETVRIRQFDFAGPGAGR